MPKLNGGTKLAGFVLSVIVIVGSVWGAAVSLDTKFESHVVNTTKEAKIAHEEGCLPSRSNSNKISMLEVELKNINKNMEAILQELKK